MSHKKGSTFSSSELAKSTATLSCDMPRGVYTALDKNSRISKREQRSLHAGLLGGMRKSERNEIRYNPNLNSGGVITRSQKERVHISRLAQWREDAIVTRAIERELAAVSAGRVAVSAGGYFWPSSRWIAASRGRVLLCIPLHW